MSVPHKPNTGTQQSEWTHTELDIEFREFDVAGFELQQVYVCDPVAVREFDEVGDRG